MRIYIIGNDGITLCPASSGKVIRWRISPSRNWYPEIRPLLPHRCDVATASWSPFVTWTIADARLVWVRPGRLGAP
jgi:hypothetical protein